MVAGYVHEERHLTQVKLCQNGPTEILMVLCRRYSMEVVND